MNPYKLAHYDDFSKVCTITYNDVPLIQGVIPERRIAEQTIAIANDAFQRALSIKQDEVNQRDARIAELTSEINGLRERNDYLENWNKDLMGDFWGNINGPKKKRKPRKIFMVKGRFTTEKKYNEYVAIHGKTDDCLFKWSNEDLFPDEVAKKKAAS